MTDTDLLPCPFCGGTASTWMGIDKYNNKCVWGVDCDICDCSLTGPYDTKDEAIEAWNRRGSNDSRRDDKRAPKISVQ